jgi:hypothetical protein
MSLKLVLLDLVSAVQAAQNKFVTELNDTERTAR